MVFALQAFVRQGMTSSVDSYARNDCDDRGLRLRFGRAVQMSQWHTVGVAGPASAHVLRGVLRAGRLVCVAPGRDFWCRFWVAAPRDDLRPRAFLAPWADDFGELRVLR